jgi:hypothetical protein
MKSKLLELIPTGTCPGIIPYAHKGEWAVHDVLPVFFHRFGAFHLSLATFNVSEDSLRPIFFMKERGELLSCRFLLDHNVKRHKIDMLFFSSGIADSVRISSTHMKVLLLENDKICMSVVGSANMNRNIRHEAGMISTEPDIYNFYKRYYEDIFKNDSLPFIWD